VPITTDLLDGHDLPPSVAQDVLIAAGHAALQPIQLDRPRQGRCGSRGRRQAAKSRRMCATLNRLGPAVVAASTPERARPATDRQDDAPRPAQLADPVRRACDDSAAAR
jgi:hypothetical protein